MLEKEKKTNLRRNITVSGAKVTDPVLHDQPQTQLSDRCKFPWEVKKFTFRC